MQEQVEVYLANTQTPQPVGTLGYRHPWGKGAYQFNFHPFWIDAYPNMRLSGDLRNTTVAQHSMNNIFGCFKDCLPGTWGRGLIETREKMLAEAEGRQYYRLNEFCYLPFVDDEARMGAFRFRMPGQRTFVGETTDGNTYLPLPALADYRHLLDIYETHPEELTIETIDTLIRYGAVIGGKRPKAVIIDPNNNVRYIAKLPSAKDEYNVPLWEYFCYQVAYAAGINLAFCRLVDTKGYERKHVLLSRRFDRDDKQRRIHYMTANTLLDAPDNASAEAGHGYMHLIRAIAGNKTMADPKTDIREIYRRVAFSICIGNHEDNYGNYSFILTPKGWKLAPAYGFHPSHEPTMRLLVTEKSNEASLENLLKAATVYHIGPQEAARIVEEVRLAVGRWRYSATRCKIKIKEQPRFADRFDKYGLLPAPQETAGEGEACTREEGENK